MSHKEIASVAEPWLLLPFVYAFKREGIVSEYSHATCYKAFEDFIGQFPEKTEDYYAELSVFASSLYEKQCRNSETYFLDKTPRYYLIIPEIIKIFPDAKFIFLFRNPVGVYSSILETWCEGKFRTLYRYEIDLTRGFKLLSDGYESLRNKAFAMRYEDYVLNPEEITEALCNYLQVPYDKRMLTDFEKQICGGRMGDPTGTKEYMSIVSDPLSKWKKTFNTSFRKGLLERYIQQFNAKTFKIQGYSKAIILEEIDTLKVLHRRMVSDRMDVLYERIVRCTKANLIFGRKKTNGWARSRYLT